MAHILWVYRSLEGYSNFEIWFLAHLVFFSGVRVVDFVLLPPCGEMFLSYALNQVTLLTDLWVAYILRWDMVCLLLSEMILGVEGVFLLESCLIDYIPSLIRKRVKLEKLVRWSIWYWPIIFTRGNPYLTTSWIWLMTFFWISKETSFL